MNHRAIAILAIAACALSFAACGGDNKVGSGVDLNLKNAAGQGRLGERTTTTAAPATTAPSGPAKAALGAETTTTTPPTTAKPVATTTPPTTQPAQQVALEIEINGDSAGVSQFNPSQARVYAGSIVRWTNKDTAARSVEADDGSFTSGPLAPGASYSYTFATAGRFNYHDGTRPYAVASVEVIPR